MLNPWRMAPHRRDGFLLAAACFFIGITFGIFSESTGLSLGKASALSLLTFTGRHSLLRCRWWPVVARPLPPSEVPC